MDARCTAAACWPKDRGDFPAQVALDAVEDCNFGGLADGSSIWGGAIAQMIARCGGHLSRVAPALLAFPSGFLSVLSGTVSGLVFVSCLLLEDAIDRS